MKSARLHPTRTLLGLILLTGSILFFVVPVQAQSDKELPPMGGGGGGTFVARCPKDQHLAGFRLRAGDDIDAIQPICATYVEETEITGIDYVWGFPQERKKYKYAAGPPVPYSSMFGGPGGQEVDLRCPSDRPFVTGMYIEIEGRNTQTVNTIQLYCWGGAETRRNCDRDSGMRIVGFCPDQYPAVEFKAPELGSIFPGMHPGFAKDEQQCRGEIKKAYVHAPEIYDSRSGTFVKGGSGYQPEPEPGLVAVGITGRAGKWLDAVGLVCGELKVTRPTNIGTTSSALSISPPPPPQFIGTFGSTPANYQPMWVYAIKDDGDLVWYRKDSGESAWQGPKRVGNGWAAGYKDAIPAGGNSIYLLSDDGKLFWYQHTGFNDGTLNWKARVEVGHGWGFAKIFSGGEGIIYAITQEGKLLWYRHNGYLTGLGTPGAWEGPKEVGTGWNGFRQAVPAGAGVILLIENNGKLRWYRHSGYLTGLGTPGAWEGPKEVGTGWHGFKNVIALLPVASAPVVR